VTYILLGLAILYAIAMLLALVNLVLVVNAGEAGTLTEARAASAETLIYNAAAGFMVFYVLSAIAFLAWLSRAVDNAPPLGVGFPPTSPTGAIGWWFVPVANLFKPYQVVADLNRRMSLQRPRTWLPLAWWLLFIVSPVPTVIVDRLPMYETFEGLRTVAVILIACQLGIVVSGVLAIAVVRAIQQAQQARAKAVGLGHEIVVQGVVWGGSQPPAPPPGPVAVVTPQGPPSATAAPVAFCPRCGRARASVEQSDGAFCAGCGLDFGSIA
jgi:hypothetical protein